MRSSAQRALRCCAGLIVALAAFRPIKAFLTRNGVDHSEIFS